VLATGLPIKIEDTPTNRPLFSNPRSWLECTQRHNSNCSCDQRFLPMLCDTITIHCRRDKPLSRWISSRIFPNYQCSAASVQSPIVIAVINLSFAFDERSAAVGPSSSSPPPLAPIRCRPIWPWSSMNTSSDGVPCRPTTVPHRGSVILSGG